ncbi:unnamed protein product, partial [marine sediment metagenome]
DNNTLVAGGRRLAAHRLLGREVIAAIFADDLDELTLKSLELEENVQRYSMTWQEEAKQIAAIHTIRVREAVNNHDDWGQRETGKLLNLSQAHISNVTTVVDRLTAGDEEIMKSRTMTDALSVLLHRKETEANKLLVGTLGTVATSTADIEVIDLDDVDTSPVMGRPKASGPAPITAVDLTFDLAKMFHLGDSIPIMQGMPEASVDHIVTDIPYGIDMANLEGNVAKLDLVVDTHDVEENIDLMHAFIPEAFRLLKPTGYLAFWYDLDHHEKLQTAGRDAGFKVQRWPITWCKSHNCRNNQPQFNFTKSTEVCMIMRKSSTATLTKPQLYNFLTADGNIERQLYDNPFAKPADCWNFILSAIAISGQTILDPFAGGMSCPRACINRGLSPIAIEIDSVHLFKGVEMIKDQLNEMTN